MAFDKRQIARMYHKRAGHYDLTANFYYLAGLREFAYRNKAVEALGLKSGNCVVELGCGTGLNFAYLQKCIGPHGHIIGVDLTESMLAKARQRARRNHWDNITFIQSDAASYQLPEGVDGVLSTFALTLVPEYDRIIQHIAANLPAGRRCVILDFKKPDKWPDWLLHTFVALSKPFGVSLDLADRHLWESIRDHMDMVGFQEFYFGAIYLCIGRIARKGGK